MKYAVIQTGGKQYKVAQGDVIEVERLSTKPGEKITWSEILLFVAEDKVSVGTPFVSGVSVLGEVMEQFRGEKIRVAKFKAKSRYRRVTGHRQALSRVKITQIGSEKAEVSEKPIKAKATSVKKAKK